MVIFLALQLMVVRASSQTTVSALVDRNQLAPGDTLTYTIAVDSSANVEVNQPRYPDLSGFEVINTWTGNEVQSLFENGRFTTKRTQTFNLQLQAQQEGVFEIGSAEVVIDGQAFRTKPVRVEVSRSARPNTQGSPPPGRNPVFPGLPSDEEVMDLDDMFNQMLQDRLNRFGRGRTEQKQVERNDVNADELFFLDVEVDKTKVYEGEQVLVTYYLYTRGRITDIDTLKYPTLVGFWKEDIELATRLNFQPIVINGIQYNRALLASYALFPIKAGPATIDSYRAKCTVSTLNPFGAAFPKQETKDSRPVKIEVLPVPKEGKPSDFAGAVGQFRLETKLETEKPVTNQPISLIYRFEGRGNAKLIEIPKFELPAGLEIYDSKSEAKFFKDGRSYKEFRLLVIPRQAGKVTLPSWSVSLFDPDKKTYYALSSDALSLDVLQGQDSNTVESRPLAQAGATNQPKAPVLPPVAVQSLIVSGHGLPAMVWVGLYTLLSLGLLWQSRRELGWGRKRENLKRLVERRINRLNELAKAKDFRKAGSSAINLVYFVLGELSGSGGGGQEINKLLESAPPSFRRQFQDSLTKLLRELEIIAFAPDAVLGGLAEPVEVAKRLKQVQELLLKALQEEIDSSVDGQAQ